MEFGFNIINISVGDLLFGLFIHLNIGNLNQYFRGFHQIFSPSQIVLNINPDNNICSHFPNLIYRVIISDSSVYRAIFRQFQQAKTV